MKKTHLFAITFIALLFVSCSNGGKNPATEDSTESKAYKELAFGMSVEKIKEMGYIKTDRSESKSDQGFDMYPSEIKDMAGVNFDYNYLCFSENQLVQVLLVKTTMKKDEALEVWDTIYNSTKIKYGEPIKETLSNDKKAQWNIRNKTIFCTYEKIYFSDYYSNAVKIMNQKLMDDIAKSKLEKYKENTDI